MTKSQLQWFETALKSRDLKSQSASEIRNRNQNGLWIGYISGTNRNWNRSDPKSLRFEPDTLAFLARTPTRKHGSRIPLHTNV